ncbi:YIP1 family protein, partial [Pseudorhodobacter sp.]|uniref:YIP1 family protein n=1 Tax=Pseudorhodobacter sp. TaxID=1934400 RepID=UPI002648E4B4
DAAGGASGVGPAMASPVRTAILQWAVLLISVHAVHRLGRMRGGTGTLNEAVILLAWLQFVLLCVQVAQIVMQVIVPPLADILGVAGLVLFLWLLTNFVAELHGFRSLALVFVGILVAVVVLAVVLAIVLTLIFGAAAGV